MGLMAAVLVGLLAGLWAALVRVGWELPTLTDSLTGVHGPLMIVGVLGTLIGLERAVALAGVNQSKLHISFAGPVITAVGALLLILVGAQPIPKLLLLVGNVILVIIFGYILQRHTALHAIVMTIGAVFQMIGTFAWLLGSPVYQVVYCWIAFLVLTIVGERLELSRVRHLSPLSYRLFAISTGLYCAAVLTTFINLGIGIRFTGFATILLVLWLFRYDIATQTIRKTGQPRFIAACLLAGYSWLMVSGIFGVISGAVYAGFEYDALLHSALLGFVFSMIFGHVLVILPAVLGRFVTYRPVFYGYLVAFHVAVAIRILGDLLWQATVRMWGGLFDVLALLAFLTVVVQAARTSAQPGKPAIRVNSHAQKRG
jgi:hypothetical protein